MGGWALGLNLVHTSSLCLQVESHAIGRGVFGPCLVLLAAGGRMGLLQPSGCEIGGLPHDRRGGDGGCVFFQYV